jgi:hypothetical protein
MGNTDSMATLALTNHLSAMLPRATRNLTAMLR